MSAENLTKEMIEGRVAGSFRDPSGTLFWRNGVLFRSVSHSYAYDFDEAVKSGLHDSLISKGLLVPHVDVVVPVDLVGAVHAVLQPKIVPFISYPYEWCFGQLQDAALLTLQVQKECARFGFSLKDASAFNVQFIDGKPVFIDTLSFDLLTGGAPWIGYKQFCQHFLAPLLLMSHVDLRLGLLSRDFIDGVPLDLASRLLPWKTRLNPWVAAHIHLHAKAQRRTRQDDVRLARASVTDSARTALVDNLMSLVGSLKPIEQQSTWSDYYGATNYSLAAEASKQEIVSLFLSRIEPKVVWDLGANDGTYSRLATSCGALTISIDGDRNAVEQNYQTVKRDGTTNLLPLVQDLTNPSPGLGWAGVERDSLQSRGKADVVMALALVHHLAIANNLPLVEIATWLARLGEWLIIEFVPKSDSQVSLMLSNRKDVFPEYERDRFVQVLVEYYDIVETSPIVESKREIFLMRIR